jgi:RNA polymerase sigma-70 factor (ECF subfamily)
VSIAPDVALAAAQADDDLEGPFVLARVRREPADARDLADPRAVLAALYSAHASAVLRFLRDLLGDATLAADATQETFARAFQRIGTVRHDDKRLGWLFGIARNVSLEYRKARRVARSRFADDEEPDAAPCRSRSPEARLLGREAAALVARALERLPEERRAALLLRLDHGLSYDEIAAALGWSVAKARVEVFRARATLRGLLQGYEGDAR